MKSAEEALIAQKLIEKINFNGSYLKVRYKESYPKYHFSQLYLLSSHVFYSTIFLYPSNILMDLLDARY